jgi:hypothetical protein
MAAHDGRYEEALKEYVWFHEHALEFNPAFCGVRLSFALAYWAELAMVYPKARTVLREIRDRKAEAILTGEPNLPLFQDVVRINEEAFSDRATYDLFVTLRRSFPAAASEYSSLALPAIVTIGDFPLARQYLPDPTEEIRRLSALLNDDVEELNDFPQSSAPCMEAYVHNYVKDIKILLAILRGASESAEADEIQASAVTLVDSPDVREAVRIGLISADPPRGRIPEFGRN